MAKLRIAEIFTSVQGEGIWVGMPSTFVRVSGCNLRCKWCDTPYASWTPEGPTMEVEEIAEEVEHRRVRHVVITGGEPMLFEPVVKLVEQLDASGHVITIETAGTVFRDLPCDLMSISPKTSNSDPDGDWQERHRDLRSDLGPLKQLVQRYKFQLKFVVNPDRDSDDFAEIEDILSNLPPIPPDRVLLMAEGTDAATLHRRERALVEICVRRGWRLTPRYHIDLFGNSKGT